MSRLTIHSTAVIDEPCEIGDGTRIWHFSHIMAGAQIGCDCNLGQNVYVDRNVKIGNGVKIQNNVSVYTGVELGDYVFCGPSCVFTNVINPRSAIERKDEFRKTIVKEYATIGANATIVCGVTVGRYAFVGAGAVVTKDVPDYGLVTGVPAKLAGWMSRAGHRLMLVRLWNVVLAGDAWQDEELICPGTGDRYLYNAKLGLVWFLKEAE